MLKTGRAKAIRFSTLEKLCEVLDCQPGDLFAFELTHVGSSSSAPRQRGYHGGICASTFTQTDFTWVYSRIASNPMSRP